MIVLILRGVIMSINFILSKKNYNCRNKVSSFECGFDPLSCIKLPFSIQFYLIRIIFLIFDVEISLILPRIILIKKEIRPKTARELHTIFIYCTKGIFCHFTKCVE